MGHRLQQSLQLLEYMGTCADWPLSKGLSYGVCAFHHLKPKFRWTEVLVLRQAAAVPPGNGKRVPLGHFTVCPTPHQSKNQHAQKERNCYVDRGNCPSMVSNIHWGWKNYVHNPGLIKHFLVLPWPVITINGQLQQAIRVKWLKAYPIRCKGSNLSWVSSPISHSCSLGSLSKINHLLTSPCRRFCSLLLKLLSN